MIPTVFIIFCNSWRFQSIFLHSYQKSTVSFSRQVQLKYRDGSRGDQVCVLKLMKKVCTCTLTVHHSRHYRYNNCIGDDTKAAARQSINCSKKIKYGAKRFSIWRMEFLHPAVWYVALGWHAIEFAQTSAILEFYIWFRFRPHHCSRHVILHQSPKFYRNWTTLGRKKWRHVDFQDGGSQPS